VLYGESMDPGAPYQQATLNREPARDEGSGVRIVIRRGEIVPLPPRDTLSSASAAAERAARPGVDLAALWQAVMDRRLSVCADGGSPGRRYVVARASDDAARPSSPLSRIETAVLVRVLGGEQQKHVAAELGIACSTASKWYTQALAKMQLTRGPLALPLVIAAQAWASDQNPPVDARSSHFEHEGSRYLVLSVPKPRVTAQGSLTPAECEVARFLVEGETRWDIAARRATSAQTVACQIRGVFSKWRLTGRYGLIRHTVELGWLR
jgi:DNA-binding NarL/FixJ family response regulator